MSLTDFFEIQLNKENMRKLIAIIILTISFAGVKAQDRIIRQNGDTIICKVSEITHDDIKYINEGEASNISKNTVQEIIFKSGITQNFSNRSVIYGEEDWEKVQITSVESDVAGMVKGEEIKATSTTRSSIKNQAKIEKKAMEKLKKKAAENGYHIVLLLNATDQGKVSKFLVGGYAGMTGVGYKYE